jgi:hypothetical protein
VDAAHSVRLTRLCIGLQLREGSVSPHPAAAELRRERITGAGFVGTHGEWSFSEAQSTSTEFVFVRDASKVGGKKGNAAVGAAAVGAAAKAKAEANPAKPAKQKAAAAAAEPRAAKQPRRASARARDASAATG